MSQIDWKSSNWQCITYKRKIYIFLNLNNRLKHTSNFRKKKTILKNISNLPTPANRQIAILLHRGSIKGFQI